jgi:hypothetical protein
MEKDDLVPVREFCIHHEVERGFVLSLQESGLIEVVLIGEEAYLPAGELRNLERMANLHYGMGINLEGIETITYLLQRMHELQRRILELNNQMDTRGIGS